MHAQPLTRYAVLARDEGGFAFLNTHHAYWRHEKKSKLERHDVVCRHDFIVTETALGKGEDTADGHDLLPGGLELTEVHAEGVKVEEADN
jgi:hypothetical protein